MIDEAYYRELRHKFHTIPELAYSEFETSDLIAEELDRYGIDYRRGLGGTGIVAWIDKGKSERSIALRADIDALPIEEESGVEYISKNSGIMHACGHDGHITMLLAAASYIKESVDFNGRVYFIFQPAEEGGAGARKMIEDGLFDEFKIDRIYGMHNRPQAPFGEFLIKKGPVMSSVDIWNIEITGKSGHSSQPHLAVNPIVVASHIVQAIKSITSQDIDPSQAHVITVAKINSGTAFNVIPERCTIEGSVRAFDESVQDMIEDRINSISKGISSAFGADVKVEYKRMYPATVNSVTDCAVKAAESIKECKKITDDFPSSMGSEDFSFYLQRCEGCYIWIGSATDGRDITPLHSSKYDFDDRLIPIGVEYWVELAKCELG